MKVISFVIPLYNTEKYIVDCIDSILEQKEIDLSLVEIIVVDDGSTDNSLAMLERYSENKNITVIKKNNSGISLTRNLGVERAKGNYIFFLDSDDKIAPGALAKIFNILNNSNVDILFFSGAVFYDIDTKNSFKPIYGRARQTCNVIMTSSEFFIKSIKYRSFFVQPCMYVFKKQLFEGNEFIPNILHEDNPFTVGLLLNNDVNVFCINDKLYQRRIRSNSIMTSAHSIKNAAGYLYSAKYIFGKYYDYDNDGSSRELKALRFFLLKLIKCGYVISNEINSEYHKTEFEKVYNQLNPNWFEKWSFNSGSIYRKARFIKTKYYHLIGRFTSLTRFLK
ncbi:glycosyltransferase [Klebsiella pneumoniae]|uniref:glycosyltransferase n=1 Tax=Klebsiella pneumoniae TaxID=573 RepID=UPI000C14E666|nr:glycosyltransferase [Klebsiella pneumoniae]MDK1956584.1 glycosyltransferase [Klebsiella pneumoniae]PHZ78924.1 hypothetical protein CQB04_22300 [Klebsiella pneumoniae]SYJ79540.1 glycosyltransferase [Klebsiella pneumoniae]HBZ5596737.1 glycosyltransferase [Klebsiella pneumoniae]HDE2113878.1 glycosyltransferase [Klebsiella pneumoniae]